jgi:RNA polymerase sigma-70 factor (ECF subfamily)
MTEDVGDRDERRTAATAGDEGDLLAAARRGDPAAWRTLVTDLSPALAGYLRLQGARDVDDLASDVLLGVLTGIDRFEGDLSALRRWVFTIAHHRLVDQRRRAHRLEIHLSAVIDDSRPVDGADPAELQRLATDRVVDLCRRLVPDQRDVLLLRLVADMTIEQIAETLGKSPGAVKALQRRALAALQRMIAHEGVPL